MPPPRRTCRRADDSDVKLGKRLSGHGYPGAGALRLPALCRLDALDCSTASESTTRIPQTRSASGQMQHGSRLDCDTAFGSWNLSKAVRFARLQNPVLVANLRHESLPRTAATESFSRLIIQWRYESGAQPPVRLGRVARLQTPVQGRLVWATCDTPVSRYPYGCYETGAQPQVRIGVVSIRTLGPGPGPRGQRKYV